ncbi:glycosyltransferase family 2 protein [Streptococcus dentiloxodontae]
MKKDVEYKPIVSVICTVYNKGQWLNQTIESFLKQKEISFEIILIDDNSTDNSKEIIQSFSEMYPSIITSVYNTENLGITKTWKKACLLASGVYIARCDGDDYWTDDYKLSKQVQLLNSFPDSKWCGTDIDFVDSDSVVTAESVFSNHIIDIADTYEKMIATRGFTAPSTWLVERELMLSVNSMLDEDIQTADDTFNLQLDLFHQTTFSFLPEVTVAYRVNEGSDSRPQNFKDLQNRFDKLLKTQYYYLDKYSDVDYKAILCILLRKYNDFEKALSRSHIPNHYLDGQYVTVFTERPDSPFSDETALQLPFKPGQKQTLQVPADCSLLRVDLSELPIYVKSVSLVDEAYGTELEPSQSNGAKIGQSYLFGEPDPQLIYDLRHTDSEEYSLSFELFNTDQPLTSQYLGSEIASQLLEYDTDMKQLKILRNQAANLESDNEKLRKQLEEMVYRYNSVVTSRRWTIPTKFINLFRRKK